MKSLFPANTQRLFTLLFLLVALIGCFALAIRQSSQALFDLPGNPPVRVLFSPAPAPSPSPDPLTQFRTRRTQHFRESEEALSRLAQEPGLDHALTALAVQTLSEQTAIRLLTERTESALAGMGYTDAVCAAAQDSVTVFTGRALDEKSSQLLTDLICEWTGLPASSVCLIGAQ